MVRQKHTLCKQLVVEYLNVWFQFTPFNQKSCYWTSKRKVTFPSFYLSSNSFASFLPQTFNF